MGLNLQDAGAVLTVQATNQTAQSVLQQGTTAQQSGFDSGMMEQLASVGATNPVIAAFSEASDAQPFTQEAGVAFEDENSRALYMALRQKGLNPLRSEIVAICEFVPVSRGENSENGAEINYELSPNQTLSVTNVARLMELHRQIRDYVSEAARLVLRKAYPDMSDETFLTSLRLNVRSAYNSDAGLSVEATFERIFDRFQNMSAINNFNTIVSENINSPFLKAIVEYYIYEKLIEDIIGYVGSLTELDLQLIQNFGITKFSLLKTFSSENTFTENKLSQLFGSASTHLTSTPEQLAKECLGLVRTNANSDTDMFLNAIGQLVSAIYFKDSSSVLSTLSQAEDSNLIVEPGKIRLGIRGDLAAAIGEIKKISFTGCITDLGSGTGPERTDELGGEYNSAVQLTNDRFFGPFNMIENAAGESRSTERGYHELMAVMAYDVVSANVDYVGSFNNLGSMLKTPNSLPEGSVFSSNYSLQRATYGNDITFAYPNFLSNFIETTTGIPISKFTSNQKEVIDRSLLPDKSNSTTSVILGFGTFTRDVLGIRTVTNQNGTTEKYMPLESTTKEPIRQQDGVPVRTAADYYVQNAVLSTSVQTNHLSGEEELVLDFSNMENDVAQYSLQAESFVHDILTLVPDHLVSNSNASQAGMTPLGRGDVTDYIRFMLSELEQDLKQIISDGNNNTSTQIPILATMLRATGTSNRKKNFAGVFWGIVEAANDFFIGKTANFDDIDGDDVDFELPDSSDIPKLNSNNQQSRVQNIIAHFVEFYNENAVTNFLRNDCNLSLNASGNNETRSFQGGSGVNYTLALGDNNADLLTNGGVRDKLPNAVDIIGEDNPGSGGVTLSTTARSIDNIFDNSFGGGTGERLEEIVGAGNIGKTLLAIAAVTGIALAITGAVIATILTGGGAAAIGLSAFLGAGTFFSTSAVVTAAVTTAVVSASIALAAIGGSIYENWTQAKVFGMARVLKRSMFSAMTGNYAPIGYQIDSDNKLNAGHDIMIGSGFVEGLIRPHPGVIGNIAGFSTQHRGLIWYQWVNFLLRKTLRINAKTNGNKLELKLFMDNVKGVIDAINRARGGSGVYNLSGADGYDHASQFAENYINTLFSVVSERQKKIRDSAALVKAHAEGLTKFKDLVENTLSGNGMDGALNKGTKLAIAVMKEENVFNDVITLNSDMMPALVYQSAARNLFTKNGSLFTQDMKFNIAKNKYMYKVLSTAGYGFLESEKRGNKSIINVGIPNSMIKALQQRGAERTGNTNFLTSPYVCVSVYKQDHMNKSYTFFPKNFVFDTSANVADYTLEGNELSNHLLNFSEDDSFESLLSKTEVHRFRSDTTGKIKKQSLVGVAGVYSNEVLTNHVHDYCLKEYFKLTTGLDFNEENFLASTSTLDFSKIVPSTYIGSDLQNEYNRIIELLTKLYPNAEEDPRFRSEVFRMTAMLRQSIPFSGRNRFVKSITPKSFDKVYSLIVNEKDFIIDDRPRPSNAAGNALLNTSVSNDQLFTSPVNFTLNGALERPAEVTPGFLYVASMDNNSLGSLGNYIASLDENYPEVYNYYVTVSLLPLNFQMGANLKFTNDDIIASQSEETLLNSGAVTQSSQVFGSQQQSLASATRFPI